MKNNTDQEILTINESNTHFEEEITGKLGIESEAYLAIETAKSNELKFNLKQIEEENKRLTEEYAQADRKRNELNFNLQKMQEENKLIAEQLAQAEKENKKNKGQLEMEITAKNDLLQGINRLKASRDNLELQSMELAAKNIILKQKISERERIIASDDDIIKKEIQENELKEAENQVFKYKNELQKIRQDFNNFFTGDNGYIDYSEEVNAVIMSKSLTYEDGNVMKGFKNSLKDLHRDSPKDITSILIDLIKFFNEGTRNINIQKAIKDLGNQSPISLRDAIDYLCFNSSDLKISYHKNWSTFTKLLEKIAPIPPGGYIMKALELEEEINKLEASLQYFKDKMIKTTAPTDTQGSYFRSALELGRASSSSNLRRG